MLQEKYALNEDQTPVAFDASGYLPVAKAGGAIHLTTALAIYVFIEFLAVASAAYFGSAIYHFMNWHIWQTAYAYILAAAIIAMLVLLSSVGLHSFVAFQRQPRHIFLWKGVGSVALGFSVFITLLFLTQSGEVYSRGSL